MMNVTEALNCVNHALMVLPVPTDGQGKRAWASLLEAQTILEAALSSPVGQIAEGEALARRDVTNLLEEYRNLVKTGAEYAASELRLAPTSAFEIYMGHFRDIGKDIEAALSAPTQQAGASTEAVAPFSKIFALPLRLGRGTEYEAPIFDRHGELVGECVDDDCEERALAFIRAVNSPTTVLQLEAAIPPGVKDETAWLIELRSARPTWWSLHADEEPGWLPDANKALRFARREDAEAYIEDIGLTDTFASEHTWCGQRVARRASSFDDNIKRATDDAIKASLSEIDKAFDAKYATPQAGVISEPVTEELADAVLSWMVKHDLLDAGNEYHASDVLAVLDDLAPAQGTEPRSEGDKMNKEKLKAALQAELSRQFMFGPIMYHKNADGVPMISYPIEHPAPAPIIDLDKLADEVLALLATPPDSNAVRGLREALAPDARSPP